MVISLWKNGNLDLRYKFFGVIGDSIIYHGDFFREASNSQIMVMPKTDPRAEKEYAIVEGETLERIVKNSLSDCALCLKNESEVKQCQLRKDLLQCGILPKPNGRGHCPFQP